LPNVPDLGPARWLEPGVLFHEVTLPREQPTRKLWVYLPERAGTEKLPCVFVAPAGSNLFTGNALGEGDRPEHLPYVRAGFAVVAYELDGPLPETPEPADAQVVEAFNSFRAAEAGVSNARMAIDYALAKIPQVDPEKLYAAGHSSAATLALLVAEREPRVKACAAYAPVTDIEAHLGAATVRTLSSGLKGFREFARGNSPLTGAAHLRCPLFLFTADDDSVVEPAQSARFAAAVGQLNPAVTYRRVPGGDHYDSMINEGVPSAVEWLRGLAGAARPAPRLPR
jgi:dienelactone hydrolase